MRVVHTEAALLSAVNADARRGAGGVRQPDRLHGEVPRRIRATSRSRCSPTSTRTRCTSASATARCSAATRRSSRKRRRRASPARLLTRIGERCAEACRKIGYRGAGTFEFLYQDDEFFFIEMNTRIQVEHPVTEVIDRHRHRPAADPRRGRAEAARSASATSCARPRDRVPDQRRGPVHVRALAGAHHVATTRPAGPASASTRTSTTNYFVPPYYDSMVGKVIAYGDTREQAIARMRIALSEMVVEGIKTNIPLHQELLLDDEVPARRHVDPLSRGKAREACLTRGVPRRPLRHRRCRAADRWSDALIDAGALSVDVSDPAAGTPNESPVYGEPGGPTAAFWALSRVEALFAADADVDAASSRRRALDAPMPLHETRGGRRPVTGVRLHAVAVRPDRDRREVLIVPTWSEPPEADALVLRPRSGTRVRHRVRMRRRTCASHGCAKRSCQASACSTTAAARASSRSPRRSSARATSRAPTSTPRRSSRAAPTRRSTASPRPSLRRMRCPRAQATSSSRTSSPTRSCCFAPALAARTLQGGRIALSGVLAEQAGRRRRCVCALVYTRRLAATRRLGADRG